MTDATLLQFACGDRSPEHPGLRCWRQRWHGGDHRAYTIANQLIEWTDPPAPPNEEDTAAMAFGDRHAPLTSLPESAYGATSLQLDENTEGVTLEHKPARTDGARLVALVRAMAAVLLLVIIACAPAVVIAAWRLLL